MARGKSRGGSPPFVALPWEILNSRAYWELPPSAAKALPYFIGKVKLTSNNENKNHSNFNFSYREAARYGFAKATFFRVITGLISNGFINPKEKGGLRGDGKSSSVFTLSSRWKKFGTPDFETIKWKEFI
jgi:hypothetical protein